MMNGQRRFSIYEPPQGVKAFDATSHPSLPPPSSTLHVFSVIIAMSNDTDSDSDSGPDSGSNWRLHIGVPPSLRNIDLERGPSLGQYVAMSAAYSLGRSIWDTWQSNSEARERRRWREARRRQREAEERERRERERRESLERLMRDL